LGRNSVDFSEVGKKGINNGIRVRDLLNNSVLLCINILSETKKTIYQVIVQSSPFPGEETRTLNAVQCNKLLATEMEFWTCSRKSGKETRRNKDTKCSIV
jgi:hypothetical protein